MLLEIESFLISEVLDECLCQVKIIGQLSRSSKEQKAEVPDGSETTESEDDDILYTAEEITPDQKLKMDLYNIETVLQDTINEIKTNRTYTKLAEFIKEYKKARADFDEFRKRIFEEQKMIPKMKKDIAEAKQQMQSEVDGMEEYIKELNFDLQKCKARTEMEKSYVQKTIQNEIEQVKKRCAKRRDEMTSENEELKYRLDYEAEADNHITEYWKQNEKELLAILQYWKHKFFDDQKLKERELATLKKYRRLNLDKIAMVSRKLKVDEDYLEKDRKEKQRQKELEEQERARNEALVNIQAWWRGVMVRKKLGPFAEKKPAKKKKGKGKKGKK